MIRLKGPLTARAGELKFLPSFSRLLEDLRMEFEDERDTK
jgi:hypothetical protein